jgi:hypothetical protein
MTDNILVITTPGDEERQKNVNLQFASQFAKITWRQIIAVMNPAAPRIGIMRSFKNCIHWAKHQKWNHVVIFEDDFLFLHSKALKDFLYLSEMVIEEPAIFLGGIYEGTPVPITNDIAKVEGKLSGLHAMVVPETLYDLILSAEEPYHLDWWLSMKAKVPIYTAYPMLIVQQDGYSHNEKKITYYTENLHLKYKMVNKKL